MTDVSVADERLNTGMAPTCKWMIKNFFLVAFDEVERKPNFVA